MPAFMECGRPDMDPERSARHGADGRKMAESYELMILLSSCDCRSSINVGVVLKKKSIYPPSL